MSDKRNSLVSDRGFIDSCAPDKLPGFEDNFSKKFSFITVNSFISLRRNPPDVGVTSGQKPCTKILYDVLQTSVGLF